MQEIISEKQTEHCRGAHQESHVDIKSLLIEVLVNLLFGFLVDIVEADPASEYYQEDSQSVNRPEENID